jgi:hypothetical protein
MRPIFAPRFAPVQGVATGGARGAGRGMETRGALMTTKETRNEAGAVRAKHLMHKDVLTL